MKEDRGEVPLTLDEDDLPTARSMQSMYDRPTRPYLAETLSALKMECQDSWETL